MPIRPMDSMVLVSPSATLADIQQERINNLQLQAVQQQAQRQQSFRTALTTVARTPSSEAYTQLMLQYPEFASTVKPGIEQLNAKEKTMLQGQMIPAFSAYLKKRPDLALEHLERLAKAYDNSNQPDKAEGVRTVIKMGQADPDAATVILGGHLSESMGKDGFDGLLKTVGIGATGRKLEAEARGAEYEADIKAPEAARAETMAEAKLVEQQQKARDEGYKADKSRMEAFLSSKYGEREKLTEIQKKEYDTTKSQMEAFLFNKYGEREKLTDIGAKETQTAKDAMVLASEAAQLPGKLAEAAARTAKFQREVQDAPTEQARKKAQLELDKAKLEQDKAELEFKREQEARIASVAEGKRTPTMEKAYLDSEKIVLDSSVRANQLSMLADAFTKTKPVGGLRYWLKEFGKKTMGWQDAESELRQRAESAISSEVIQRMPPGPASDKDVEFVRKGFPPEGSSAENVASFLRGLVKVDKLNTEYHAARLEWINRNQSLAVPARKDFKVGRFQVKAGDTFNEGVLQRLIPKTEKSGSGSPTAERDASRKAEILKRLGVE